VLKHFVRIVVVAVVTAVFIGCESLERGGRTGSDNVPVLNTNAANTAHFPLQQIEPANNLYVAKCAKCHKFYNPADYSQEEWDKWMRKMSRKAKLNPEQSQLLHEYLAAFRETNAAVEKR
jgi:hypothetical protein